MEIEEYTIGGNEDEPRSRRMEMVLGLALVAAVLGFVLFNYVRQELVVGHYHAGLDALNNKQPDVAISELQAADGYLDSAALIELARVRVEQRDMLYEHAVELAGAGKWWQAARMILNMREIQESYKDSDALLAHAREINGPIFYSYTQPAGFLKDGTPYYYEGPNRIDIPDNAGIYVAQVDGEDGHRIVNSEAWMPRYAVSPDKQSLVYSVPEGQFRLYNGRRQSVTRLIIPAVDSTTGAQSVDFSPDGKTLVLSTADTAFTFNIGEIGSEDVEELEPVAQESKVEYESRQQKSLELFTDEQKVTQVAIRTRESSTPQVVSTEPGTIDGALFTKDQRYLLYRVCELTNGNRTFECSLKLVDLTALDPEVQIVTTREDLPLSDYDESLLGEFTEDEEHVLLKIGYLGHSETFIYDIATGETSKIEPDTFAVTTGRGRDDVYVVGTDYLLDDYVPGLEAWKGTNSLARTVQNQRRPADHYTKVKSHWVTVTPNNRFVLSLNSHITESARFYKLSVATLTWNSAESPDDGRALFSTKALPREWLPSTRVLGDGYTLIASAPLDSSYLSDIRAYNLDGEGEDEVMLVEAARLLDLYSFPEKK